MLIIKLVFSWLRYNIISIKSKMHKKSITTLINKNSNRIFLAIPRANFHASKAVNVEVKILL
jgi:hypothetical protein